MRNTVLALALVAMAATSPQGSARAASANLTQPVGTGDLPAGRTDGVEHVFATGPMAMHALVRRGDRTDLLAFRDPAPRTLEDIGEGGTCWAESGPDDKVTFHLRTKGQVS